MNRLKQVLALALLLATTNVLVGCDDTRTTITEDELRTSLIGRWEFWEVTEIGLFLTTLNFTDNWHNDYVDLDHDVVLTIGGLSGEPNIHFLYMRFYLEEDEPLVTIYGYGSQHEEVKIFDEQPITVSEEVLHIGEHTFYLTDSTALEDHIVDVLSGNE